MRMGMRRFTRLTNGFSKKAENHAHMIALYFLHYNFARMHRTLKQTPAMAAGITDHCWTAQELLSFHVPPPHWTPPKQRGRPAHALKRLIERWCS